MCARVCVHAETKTVGVYPPRDVVVFELCTETTAGSRVWNHMGCSHIERALNSKRLVFLHLWGGVADIEGEVSICMGRAKWEVFQANS